MSATIKYDVVQLAKLLGWQFEPTKEQAAVIEFLPFQPELVIAGAGSGKTETMARKVVWLVANGLAKPDQILGLTFTRKATRELKERVSNSLVALSQSGVDFEYDDVLEAPTIQSYNAFANQLFADNALRIGREPESRLLTDAGAWKLAHEVLYESADERLAGIDARPSTLLGAIISLNRAITDNVVDREALQEFAGDFRLLRDLPLDPKGRKRVFPAAVAEKIAKVSDGLDVLLPLATEYENRKKARSLIEYVDQVFLALRALQKFLEIIDAVRKRYRYVILDEYQDTSVLQMRLLSTLFHDTAVTAVGDPNQAIYGWRGASEGNLHRFLADFAFIEPEAQTNSVQGGKADYQGNKFTLSTSFRNDQKILDFANTLVKASPSNEDVIQLGARQNAGPGTIDHRAFFKVDEEAEFVAREIQAELANDPSLSSALLFRKRKDMESFVTALHDAGIPHHVIGLGDVLDSPEVVDLISMLAVLDRADAGNELIRLLTGGWWRVGLADIVALNDLARFRGRFDEASAEPMSPEMQDQVQASVEQDDKLTLLDALEYLSTTKNGAESFPKFSAAGFERLQEFGRLIAKLRAQIGRSIPELIRELIEVMRLDIELLSNERISYDTANLDAFLAKSNEFWNTTENASLGAFITWAQYLKDKERIDLPEVQVEPGTVQVMTIHAAKGLEWDVVVLPHFVESKIQSTDVPGWLALGRLPYPFRGDARDLPNLDWQSCQTADELEARVDKFSARIKTDYVEDERKVAYVGITRAKRRLIITSPVKIGGDGFEYLYSPFLDQGGLDPKLIIRGPLPEQKPEPNLAEAETFIPEPPEDQVTWPQDPLGSRREQVEAAAARVMAGEDHSVISRDLAETIEILLAERASQDQTERFVVVPERLSASHLGNLFADPEDVATSIARPIPQAPSRVANLGTAFHGWVEQYYSKGGIQERIDADLFDDEGVSVGPIDQAEMERLVANFLRHDEWPKEQAVFVEQAVAFTLLGRSIRCKLDAVFDRGAGKYEIVDWKTGALPKDNQDLERKQLQLALYRLALSQWQGIPLEHITASFYYVAHDKIVRPASFDNVETITQKYRDSVGLIGFLAYPVPNPGEPGL